MTNPFDVTAEHEAEINRSSADTAIAIVSDAKIDPIQGPVVRVTYTDCAGKVSAWLPYAQRNTVGTSNYSLPRLRERVIVQKLSNGRENAVVMGSIYSAAVSNPPQANPDDHTTTFDDGSTISIDPNQGTAEISMTQDIQVLAGANILTANNGTLTMESTGAIQIDGSSTLTVNIEALTAVTVHAAINVTASDTITVKAPLINLNGVRIDSSGNVTIPGTLTVKGATNVVDINISGVETGGGST